MSGPTPDPRVLRTRRLALAAAAAILEEEGAAAVTHQRVAQRAGVGRATIYRHWPQPVDLLMEALGQVNEPLLRKGDGPIRRWLSHELTHAATELQEPLATRVLVAVLGSAVGDNAFAAMRDGLLAKTEAPLVEAVDQALISGELHQKPDASELLAQLLGPLIFRIAIQRESANSAFIERVIDTALEQWR